MAYEFEVLSGKILEAAVVVHKALGPGFLESVYQKAMEDIHYAQVKSYLKATVLHVGLLLNFNAPTLVVKRVVL